MGRTLTLAVALWSTAAVAEGSKPTEMATPAPESQEKADAWQAALYLDGYMLMGESGYLVPTVFVDRGPIHLEARFNYEDFNTASAYFGWAFRFGDESNFVRLVPMFGGAVGNSNGIAPGLEIEAQFWRFTYWLEAEYFFNFTDSTASFFYTWSELNFRVVSWLTVGGTFQRMRLAQSERALDIGPMVGVNVGGFALSFYFYGLWTPTRWGLLTLSLPFF
ncbi:MAG: hypothetical protein AB1938_07280 [Myxococcota bacterium]